MLASKINFGQHLSTRERLSFLDLSSRNKEEYEMVTATC